MWESQAHWNIDVNAEGFTKHFYFLCLWDSCTAPEHYAIKECPARNR